MAKLQLKKGVVVYKGKKWLKIVLNGHENGPENFLLINELSKNLNVGDTFSMYVNSVCKKDSNGHMQWFHIPQQKGKKHKYPIVIGFGVDNMIIQPCIGNVFVKGDRVLKIVKVKQKDDGWSFGYTSELWWELHCEDITDTPKGQTAMKQQLNRLEL